MKTLTQLWQLTMGEELQFAEYVRIMCLDCCSKGDKIANILSYQIESYINHPPSYKDNKYFMEDNYAQSVLFRVFEWFYNYKKKIKADPYWAD